MVAIDNQYHSFIDCILAVILNFVNGNLISLLQTMVGLAVLLTEEPAKAGASLTPSPTMTDNLVQSSFCSNFVLDIRV